MILHQPRHRPEPFAVQRAKLKFPSLAPLLAIEWVWEWAAYLLSNWSFLEVLEYLGSFSVLIAVIFYYSESGDRLKQKHYQAWQVINTAQGKGGNGGRIEALEELNQDGVPLVGVDLSGSFLQGIRLQKADLTRANLSAADVREGQFTDSDLTFADFHSANFRNGVFRGANLEGTDLHDADLFNADLSEANLSGVNLSGADLRGVSFKGTRWDGIQNIERANIAEVKDAPVDFVKWALKHGATAVSNSID